MVIRELARKFDPLIQIGFNPATTYFATNYISTCLEQPTFIILSKDLCSSKICFTTIFFVRFQFGGRTIILAR